MLFASLREMDSLNLRRSQFHMLGLLRYRLSYRNRVV